MFVLKDNVVIDVTIGKEGNNLVIGPGNLLHCIIVDNMQFLLPVLELRFIDYSGRSKKDVTISDGTMVYVAIGKDNGDGQLLRKAFRTYAVPESAQVPNGYQYKILAVLDENKYLRGQVKKCYQDMISTDAIKAVANDCQITDVYLPKDSPDDKMTWLPAGKSYGNFIHHICDHGWIDDKSCMVLGLSSDYPESHLMYVNLTEELKLSPTSTFSSNPQGGGTDYKLIHHRSKNFGGFMNHWVGYGHQDIEETINGDHRNHKDVKATKLESNFNMNEDVKKDVDLARRTYQPIDCGNVSEKFTKAAHQNNRLRATYSSVIEVVTNDFTKAKLFDIVAVNLSDPNTLTMEADSTGNYIVGAKIKMVLGTRYFEKFRLVSTGSNADPDNQNV